MRPSPLLQEKMPISTLELEEDEIIRRTLKSRFPGCPIGTVPIRRTQKEDLIRANLALSHYSPTPIALPNVTPPEGVHVCSLLLI